MYVSHPGSICGLPKLLDLGAEERMLNVIIPSCVNRRLQEWVPRSHYSAPLSAGSPLCSPLKQHLHEEGMCGVWGHEDLGSNSAFYFVCGHGLQLISLILSFSVKIRGLINSQVIGRIKRECDKHLAWCGRIVTISTVKFLSLPLSPDFNSLLSVSNSILSLCQFQLVKVNLDSAKRKHTKPRMFPSTLTSKMKTWLCLLECA